MPCINRENKKPYSFKLSGGCMALVKSIGVQDGCSDAEVLTVAINLYQQHRNTLTMLLEGQRMSIPEGIVTKEPGVYEATVEKCKHIMAYEWGFRGKSTIMRVFMACEYHLENDDCTDDEREVFTRYIAWFNEEKPPF